MSVLLASYFIITLVAIYLNRFDNKALTLTIAVSVGALMPITKDYGAGVWYGLCALTEISILCFAMYYKSYISKPIIILSLAFVVVHFLGYKFHGYIAGSPYRYFAKTLEVTELLTCCIMSIPVINYLKERFK